MCACPSCLSLPQLDETPILRAACRNCQRRTATSRVRFVSKRRKDLTRGSPNLPLPGRIRVCYSPLPFPTLVSAYGWDWVSSPRFPQGVEKIVEKHPGTPDGETELG